MDPSSRPGPTLDPPGRTEHASAGPPAASGDAVLGWIAALLILFGPLVIWGTGVLLTAGAVPSESTDVERSGFFALSPREGILFMGGYYGLFVVPVATAVTVAVGRRGPVRTRLGRVITVLVVFALGVAMAGALQAASPPNV